MESSRKAHHEIVVERLRGLMAQAGLDALLTVKNENLTYVNTLGSAFLAQSQMAGLALIVVPRAGDVFGLCCDFERPALASPGMVTRWYDFPMWIYIDDQFLGPDEQAGAKARTEFYELGSSLAVLKESLRAAGLEKGRLGLETLAVQAPVWQALKEALPQADLVDAAALYYQARAVKTAYEIDCLRRAAAAQEEAVFAVMAEARLGQTQAELLAALRSRLLASPEIDAIRFLFVAVGTQFAPCLSPYEVSLKPGDLVKYDGALVRRGYGADAAWTFIAGRPSPDQARVNEALLAAHLAAVGMMGPGVIPRDVFNQAMKVVREKGLPHFVRGHVGHSVGLDQTIEEPPFLSPASVNPMVPGNVFCVELPYYAHNFGSIMNEDIVLITEEGHELLTKRERRLHPLGQGV
ncbi:MAG: M24 family metallopeptidase [Thermodesulfobacteriota bacterium]